MKLLSLNAAILASIFGLLSCQKSDDDSLPENAPAMLQSISQAPDGEKFLLTKSEHIAGSFFGGNSMQEFQYTPQGVLKEWRGYDANNEHYWTAKFTYDQGKVTMIQTDKNNNTFAETVTFNLSSSGWPKSLDLITKEASKVVYTYQEEYILNAEDYLTEASSSYIEYSADDPPQPLVRGQERSRYFYEDDNLVKIEEYDEGSPTPTSVLIAEYDKSKRNLLKGMVDEGYGLDVPFHKPSKNLLTKVEQWHLSGDDPELKLYLSITNTYAMGSHGLPAERVSTWKYSADNVPLEEEKQYTTKFTYTKL